MHVKQTNICTYSIAFVHACTLILHTYHDAMQQQLINLKAYCQVSMHAYMPVFTLLVLPLDNAESRDVLVI